MRTGFLTALCIAVASNGCVTTHQPISGEILSAGGVRTFARAVVITRDSTARELINVRVAEDSVTGETATPATRVAVPTPQVARIEVLERVPSPIVNEPLRLCAMCSWNSAACWPCWVGASCFAVECTNPAA